MKRTRMVLATLGLLLAVAVCSLAAAEITTPTDLDMVPAWTGTIQDGDSQVHVLNREEFGLLTLTPPVNGIYAFSAPNGATPGGGYVSITLYDTAGDPVYLYDSLNDALSGNTMFGYENPNLYHLEPMVILESGETIRIAVRINWSMTYNEPADNQDFTLCLSCTPLEGTCGANLSWSLDLNTQTLTVSGSGPMDNYASLGQAPWSDSNGMIHHVVIEGATSIGDRAFAMTDAEDIVIPETMQSIGRSVFNMTGIQQVTLRSHVTEVDANAFDGASGINVHCEAGSAALAVAKAKGIDYTLIPFPETLTLPADTVTIENLAFANLGERVNIAIPAGTRNIATDAFANSTVLLMVVPGSPAETWAQTNSFPYIPMP